MLDNSVKNFFTQVRLQNERTEKELQRYKQENYRKLCEIYQEESKKKPSKYESIFYSQLIDSGFREQMSFYTQRN
jgi:hypothetical protein